MTLRCLGRPLTLDTTDLTDVYRPLIEEFFVEILEFSDIGMFVFSVTIEDGSFSEEPGGIAIGTHLLVHENIAGRLSGDEIFGIKIGGNLAEMFDGFFMHCLITDLSVFLRILPFWDARLIEETLDNSVDNSDVFGRFGLDTFEIRFDFTVDFLELEIEDDLEGYLLRHELASRTDICRDSFGSNAIFTGICPDTLIYLS